MSLIHDFFKDLDRSWALIAAEKIRLPIIGATALLLQTDYKRRTKDGDVLETAAIDDGLQSRLLSLAGKDSRLHKRNGIYLEVVSSGLPILPQRPQWIPIIGLTSLLTHFQIEALHVVDVVISKLKRFHANDQQDIEAMIDRSLVPHDQLVTRFRSAIDNYALDARAADDLPRCIKNLHQIERDVFFVDETDIDLPPGIDC